MPAWLIDGNITEHLRAPRCRIEWKHTDRPMNDWDAELIEWMGEEDPPPDVVMFATLFAQAAKALYRHRKGKA